MRSISNRMVQGVETLDSRPVSCHLSAMTRALKTDVKICGLSTAEALEAALFGGASHLGFVFFEKSPRHISLDSARTLSNLVAGRARRVAVTVDAGDETLGSIVSALRPDILQLHGSETPERVAAVKARFDLPVMKALAIRTAADLAKVAPYRGLADRFLFDAKAPAGSELPGGNGIAFDWSLLAALDEPVDYMLSGGLDERNVTEALEVSGAAGIDVSSGVERAPGVKDASRIASFLRTVAAYEQDRATGLRSRSYS